MKTNLFRVREKNEEKQKIVIEEERTKNPFLLFFIRHKNFLMLSGILLLICLLLISTGVIFTLFRGSNDYDISYIEGSENINSNKDPSIDKDDIKNELLGEVSRKLGIVLEVKTIMTDTGDVITFYTDGTAVIVRADGKIYRVSTNKDGNYGVNNNGKIDDTAKRILVTSTTTTLADGTIITYYSDGTAKVEHKSQVLFVRDSNNIKINNGTSLDNLAPSGVAPTTDTNRAGSNIVKTFTDKTSLVIIDGQKYIVNKNTEVNINGDNITYSKKNSFNVISEKTYKDGNIITHFENGSAIITEPNGNVTYVKKSGDIILKDKKLYEIMPNDIGYSRTTFDIPGNKKVTYFDNGGAVIINPDGTRQYIPDSDDIVYDDNKNITGTPESAKQISEKVTDDGKPAFNFDNGKSQVINPDGSSYIIDTDKLKFKPPGGDKNPDSNPKPEEPDNSGGTPSTPKPKPDPGEGIEISEAENIYNNFKNVENTKFIIRNKNNRSKRLRITIEEVSDYKKYNTDRLDPKFVKFQATVGDIYVPETTLTTNTWRDSDNRVNYIIYEGTVGAKSTSQVALSLYVDYAPLDNSYQNKGFIGTIRIYVDEDV